MIASRRVRGVLGVRGVIALVALGAVVGAGGPAQAAQLTQSRVRQIAAAVLHQQAPRLTVAHAVTANAAASAGTAVVAQDAVSLGGRPPASYGETVAYSHRGDGTTLGVSPVRIGRSVTLKIPAGVAAVRLTAAASFEAPQDLQAALYLGIGSDCDGDGPFTDDVRTFVHGTFGGSAVLDRVLPVAEATYTFTLCGRAYPSAVVHHPSLVVETLAAVGSGS